MIQQKFPLNFPFDQARMKLEKLSNNKYPHGKCILGANLNCEFDEHIYLLSLKQNRQKQHRTAEHLFVQLCINLSSFV